MTDADDQKDSAEDLQKASADVTLAITSVAAVGGTCSVVAGIGWGLGGFFLVFVGATIAVANLYIFKKLGQAFLTNKGSSRATWGVIGAVKFVVLAALVFFLLRYRIVGPLPLIVGYAALPVGITLSSLLGARYDGDPK
jgi:hypothetical protein